MTPGKRHTEHDGADHASKPCLCTKFVKAAVVTGISGVHPYADEFPMASEDEIDALAENIAAVGLIHAIVITPDGLVLDGRNRIEACKRAGTKYHTEVREGSDDDYKEFVIGVNTTGRRESMTVSIAAASAALVLGQERRKDGRWVGWKNKTLQNSVKSRAESEAYRLCGLILDVLGCSALREVRDGKSLNSVYERAIATRESKRLERERLEKEAAEEAAAQTFVEDRDPELAALVGTSLKSYVEAKAVWEKRNREAAAAIREEEAMRAAARIAELSAWGKACDGLLAALSFAASSSPPEDTDRYPTVGTFFERYEALGARISKWKGTDL
jgi:hypothetical protein